MYLSSLATNIVSTENTFHYSMSGCGLALLGIAPRTPVSVTVSAMSILRVTSATALRTAVTGLPPLVYFHQKILNCADRHI